MRYLSVCSGIEAASVAWGPLGWTPVGFAEVAAFPSKVLAHRFGSNLPGEPLARNGVPNHGDFTAIDVAALGPVDLLVGGTPCQAFSVAGRRASLADARGNLSLSYAVLAHDLVRTNGLRWALWENVPGVLSTGDNAFGCLLGALVGGDDPVEPVARPRAGRSNAFWRWRPAGVERDDDGIERDVAAGHVTRWPCAGIVAGPLGRAAWRVLDAQYFGLAQRRRRVFVVVGFADGADPAAVLFERQGLRRHPPPRGEAGEGVARPLAAGAPGGGRGRRDAGGDEDATIPAGLPLRSVRGGERRDVVSDMRMVRPRANGAGQDLIAHSLRARHNHSHREDHDTLVVGALCANGKAAGSATQQDAETGMLVSVAYGGNDTRRPVGVAAALNSHGGSSRLDFASETFVVAHALRGEGFDASEDGTGRGTPIMPVCFDCKAGDDTGFSIGTIPGALRGVGHAGGHVAIPFDTTQITAATNRCDPCSGDWAVRRLTPTECHRLQGFRDDWCAIPGAADGPIYAALGNSMAVPVIAWIGRRLAAVDAGSDIRTFEPPVPMRMPFA